MNSKGFTLIEVMVSIILIMSVLYGLSIIPLKLVEIKSVVVDEYDSDLSVLKLKQTIDNKILHGGIIESEDVLKIGNSNYILIDGVLKFKGIDEDINYSSDDNFAFFSLKNNPDKKLRYLMDFSSYDLRGVD